MTRRLGSWMTGCSPVGKLLAICGSGLLALFAVNHYATLCAERRNPPKGKFVSVDGLRLHYVEKGEGPPVVLLHGNASMLEDFLCSKLVDFLSVRHRVIVFDRIGYGHSRNWGAQSQSPVRQARILGRALNRFGVREALVLGHSWGTFVAIELTRIEGLSVTGLVLISGFYAPASRLDIWLGSLASLPVLGTFLSHTLLPVVSFVAWPSWLRKLFMPRGTWTFANFPKAMTFRPFQIRTAAEETALIMRSTRGLVKKCNAASVPIIIMAGARDHLVSPDHSRWLHRRVARSRLEVVPNQGHMVHHTAVHRVFTAVETLASELYRGV